MRLTELVSCLSIVFATAPALAAPPEIVKLEPSAAQAGQTVRILGEHLKRTQTVHFLAGSLRHAVKFRVKSDGELTLTVPPELEFPAAEALIVVSSLEGIAVTCPATETVVRASEPQRSEPRPKSDVAVFHVIRGGVLRAPDSFTIIADGGVVHDGRKASTIFVKNGGMLGATASHSSSSLTPVFFEPDAQIAAELARQRGWEFIAVKTINVAEGVGPLRLKTAR
jgi:hypothetical protein